MLGAEFKETLDERLREVLMTEATVDGNTSDDAAEDQYSSTLKLLHHLAKISTTVVRIAPSTTSDAASWYASKLPGCTLHDLVSGKFVKDLENKALHEAGLRHVRELEQALGNDSPALRLSKSHGIELRSLGGFHALCLERLQRHEYL
jgi:hypothetical protein